MVLDEEMLDWADGKLTPQDPENCKLIAVELQVVSTGFHQDAPIDPQRLVP